MSRESMAEQPDDRGAASRIEDVLRAWGFEWAPDWNSYRCGEKLAVMASVHDDGTVILDVRTSEGYLSVRGPIEIGEFKFWEDPA